MNNMQYLDLRGTPCPLNLIRCSLVLENLNQHDQIKVDIDKGEPESLLIPGLSKAGHSVEVICDSHFFLTLLVTCGG